MARILVVDDEPDARTMLGHYLESEGYEVAFAANGWEGLLMLDQWPCDLVLLDMMMPGLDGVKFLNILRGQPVRGNVPVVIVTALARDEALSRLKGNEPQGLIEKKGEQFFKNLLSRVQTILTRPGGDAGMDGVMN